MLSMLGLAACGRTPGATALDGGGGTAGSDASAGDMTTADASDVSTSLYLSGSRLKARYVDAGGGARKFEGWYDTKLASPCTFQFTEDGVLRCAPMGDGVLAAVDYADPGCSEPITDQPGSAYEAPYFVSEAGRTYPTNCPKNLSELNSQSVSVLVDVWRIGGRRSVPAARYFRYVGGECTMRSPSDVQEVYSIEKVQPSEMVAATSRVEPRGAALAVTVYEAEDGARMLGSLFDARELQPCTPSWVWTASGDYRCYPSAPPRTPPGNQPSCGAASFCPGDLAIGYGAPCGAATLQRRSTCEMVDSTKSPSLISDLLGTGPVKLVVARAADDARPLFVNPPLWSAVGAYRPGPFFDTAADRTCDAVTIDGALRCLPTDAALAQTYADSGCTQLVLLTPDQPSMGCAGATVSKPRLAIGGKPTRLYGVGDSKHLDQTWHTGSLPDSGCEASGVPADVYELAPMDASSLPLLTKAQD